MTVKPASAFQTTDGSLFTEMKDAHKYEAVSRINCLLADLGQGYNERLADLIYSNRHAIIEVLKDV